VAGSADDGFEVGAGVNLLRCADRGLADIGVEVYAIGSDVEGELRGTVDEDTGLVLCRTDLLNDTGGEKLELGEGEIPFADLDSVNTTPRPGTGQFHEAVAPGVFMAVEETAIRNGIEKHRIGLV
jgi:hypothetical protein